MSLEKLNLSAGEAAAELNVSRATLYAYVSRGLIRSEAAENGRNRLYSAKDVRHLRDRKSPRGGRESGAREALNFGAPVLSSAITLITDDRLYYRGRDAIALAATASLENVASLLWQQDSNDVFAAPPLANSAGLALDLPPGLPASARAQTMLAVAGAADPRAYNLAPDGVARSGAKILRLLIAAFGGAPVSQAPAHEQLARAWSLSGDEADLMRMAMVLCADHELNASTFTVRCVASTGATPHGAVAAGLAALQGPRHGGQTARVAVFLDEIDRATQPQNFQPLDAVAARMQRGESLPGFGHPVYVDADPRAVALMAAMVQRLPEKSDILQRFVKIAACATELSGLWPNVDFALATLVRVCGLPAEAALAIFAIGRCAGWLAHAQEQYEARQLIRPRARYIGDEPQPAH